MEMEKRDSSHGEQIERWARYIKENPDVWKKKFKKFSDAQILLARKAYEKLSETEGGRRKIKLLKELK